MTKLHEAHVKGAKHQPLLEHTIADALAHAAATWPEQDAVVSVHQNVRWTYAQLKQKAEALAAGLHRLGLRKGDRVGIWAPNMAEWTLTQFATAQLGLILVNVNPAYRVFELDYALNKVELKALIAPVAYKTSEYAAMVESLAPEIADLTLGQDLTAKALPHLRHVILIGEDARPGWLSLNDLSTDPTTRELEDVRTIAAGLDASEPINIQFTSGTTGMPKGATLSHRNILNNGNAVGHNIGLRPGDRLCIPVPLYHCFGMVMGNLGCLTHGAAMVYPAPTFDPGETLKAVEAEKCTGLYGVPTMFIAELAQPDFANLDLSSLRTGCMAGSPCPVEVMKQVVGDMHMKDVTIAYGMTETSPVSFQSTGDDPLDRRVSTIGRVLPHVECKIVDENDQTVSPGVPGELCTKGYSVMIGYWGDEEKTAEVLSADGWMHTGDLATIDDAGYGNIVGRIKDMIIRGGENIYPREIEEFLFTHPAVEDVAVLGVPDDKYGEEVCAWIRLKPSTSLSAEDVKTFCDGQIARFKVPRYIEFVDELPMTVTGKIRKIDIREAMVAKLGLSTAKTA
ncbi:MAG: AMP-binding protein [Alphaproteobacteria bacterium]|nr:AMP-binding protein [Alphaproteobacteria bacterium]